MEDVGEWLLDHIYVPILCGVALLLCLLLLLYCCCRKRRNGATRYVYKRLEHEAEVAEQMNRERETQQNILRDNIFMTCQWYLRSHPNYKKMEQLKELGSRIDKHWFQVTDIRTNQDRLLSCLQFNSKMPIPFTAATSKTLKDLFSLLQHPYIHPTSDFEFAVEHNLVFVFQPVSVRGSLKDFIYQCRYSEAWYAKYSQRQRGLSVHNIKTFGKQVLTGLLYLEQKGFPIHGNIQSGNIMFEDGICRISGYENKFLGNTSRVYALVKKKLKEENKNALDSISFGHLLYEMAFGFELAFAQPEPQHLIGHQSPAIVEIINFIFENESGRYPTISEIAEHSFFAGTALPELKRFNPVKIHLSEPMKALLKAVKKGKPLKPPKPSSSTRKKKSKGAASVSSSRTSTPSFSTSTSTQPPPRPPSAAPAPPPPPPPPPPGPSAAPPASSGRSALLGAIAKGTKLKKCVTNDRSAPKV